jgi:(E)-4-hydroxy-3-methylbut-2-enyl-diphosphate synthase
MADADFGYVGGAPGKIDLYLGKEVIRFARSDMCASVVRLSACRRHIPNEGACDELIEIIKQHGLWVDPPVEANA